MSQDSRLNIYLKASSGTRAPRPPVKFHPPRMGYLRQTELGEIWVVDWEYESGYLHGRHELARIPEIPDLLDFNLKTFNPSKATVIDTETTGLAGGTGTYAFIIGAGFWKSDRFIIRQYMMRDFNEEPAQLMALAEDFTGSVITYNGKCFDLPLLKNRYRLHRFEIPFENAPHLDMLFPCRRIWKRNLGGFKLTQIEESVLGYARSDDIPSHLIPSIFFDYLQSHNEGLLYPILHHNRDDILSLYHLVNVSSVLIDQCLTSGSNDDSLLLSLAEIYFNIAEYDKAIILIDKIKPDFAPVSTFRQALLLRALAHKKVGRWEEAAKSLNGMIDMTPEIYSSVELAKIYEHKLKDPVRALEMVQKAEAILEFQSYIGESDYRIAEELAHRRNRLQRKINRMLQI